MNSIDPSRFSPALGDVLRAHGVDPHGDGPVPIESMDSISRDVGLSLAVKTLEERYECLNLLIPEVLDRSMTGEGRRIAMAALANGLGLSAGRPS